ncbi:potassium transporter, partial [Gongronella butleri]
VFSKWAICVLAYQCTGVIYGDIGTSPLYVYSSTFTATPSRDELLGALSMIIWTLTIVVTIKYVFFVLAADDYGEGGTFALYTLISRYANISFKNPYETMNREMKRYKTGEFKASNRSVRSMIENSPFLRRVIMGLAIAGVSLVMADGALTPAQSVLGAIQGLELKVPNITQSAITGISEVILILLFLGQPFGTTKIGSLFAPVVIVWLLFNLSIGLYNVILYDYTVLYAFSPYWIYKWFAVKGADGWVSMGGILLAFTGVEALFADLGHFSKMSVRLSWCFLAYPSLLFAYIGQAAFISSDASGTAWSNPFFASVPPSAFWFSFVLAILAAVVASQAMITGCFSLLTQAMSLYAFPTMPVVHTSEKFHGQVYVPIANWLLMIATVVITAAFPNTTALGNAYGACVTSVTLITTFMITLVSILVWRWPVTLSVAFFLFFGFIDGAYLSATLLKVPTGAWVTYAIAAVLSCIMGIWHSGKVNQWRYERARTQSLGDLISADAIDAPTDNQNASHHQVYSLTKSGERLQTIHGITLVFDSAGFNVPPVFSHFCSVYASVPDISIFVHHKSNLIPFVFFFAIKVSDEERMVVFRLALPNMYRVIIRRGFRDSLF